jgi:hypothetical protein
MLTSNKVEEVVRHTKEYVQTKAELGKLQLIEKSSAISGELMVRITLMLIGALILLFFSVAGALAAGEWFGKYSTGFLCLGGAYWVAGVFLYVFRTKLIKQPVENGIIRSILNENEND